MPRNFVRKIRRKNLRTRALTGRGLSPQQLEAVTRAKIGASLDTSLQEQVTAENIRSSREASDLRRQKLKNQAGANTVSGIVGVGQLGLAASKNKTVQSLASKVAGKFTGAQSATSAAVSGVPITNTVGGATTAPVVGSGTAIGQSAGSLTTTSTASSPAPTVAGSGSTLAGVAGAAGAGFLGAKIGQSIFTGGKKGGPTQTLVGGVSGAATGVLYGTYIMPGLGTLIGGAIGAVGGFLSDLF